MSDPALEAALHVATPVNEANVDVSNVAVVEEAPPRAEQPVPEILLSNGDLWHLREINTRFEVLAMRRQIFRLEQQVAETALQNLSQQLLTERDDLLADVARRYGVDPSVSVDLQTGRLTPTRNGR